MARFESTNMATARTIAGVRTTEVEVHAHTRSLPREHADNTVTRKQEIEFYDEELGENLRSVHYVTVSRYKPEGYDEADEFPWEESDD